MCWLGRLVRSSALERRVTAQTWGRFARDLQAVWTIRTLHRASARSRPVQIAVKDKANECKLSEPRVAVAPDASPAGSTPPVNGQAPRNPGDARSAFDALFKKP